MVKEWAEKAGLKLLNYDGFVRIYEKMVGESDNDFSSHIENRMRNAGEILCTRRAFQVGLNGCTMYFPTIDAYESMLEVIPDFVEDNVTISISIDGRFNQKQDPRSKVENLLKAMKIKLKAREKRLELATIPESIDFEKIEGRILKPKEIKEIKQYGDDVGSAEIKLMHQIINDLENILRQKKIKPSKIPNKKLEFLTGLYFETSKIRNVDPKEEEYMFINIPGLPKEPFVQPYRIIGLEGITTGVTFDIHTDKGRVRGAMRTTPEMDAKIRESQEPQEEYEDFVGLEEGGQALALPEEVARINKSLEIIDEGVPKESRMELMERLENFVRKIRDFFRKDGDGR